MSYFDVNLNLTEEDRALKEAARKFAREVIRPVAREIEGMTPEQAIAENSPSWPFLKSPMNWAIPAALSLRAP